MIHHADLISRESDDHHHDEWPFSSTNKRPFLGSNRSFFIGVGWTDDLVEIHRRRRFGGDPPSQFNLTKEEEGQQLGGEEDYKMEEEEEGKKEVEAQKRGTNIEGKVDQKASDRKRKSKGEESDRDQKSSDRGRKVIRRAVIG